MFSDSLNYPQSPAFFSMRTAFPGVHVSQALKHSGAFEQILITPLLNLTQVKYLKI